MAEVLPFPTTKGQLRRSVLACGPVILVCVLGRRQPYDSPSKPGPIESEGDTVTFIPA